MFEINILKFLFNLFFISLIFNFFKKIIFNMLSSKFFNMKFFFLIIIFNLISMFPYGLSITSLTTNLVISFTIWFSMFYYYMFFNSNSNISHFLPVGTPFVMMFFLVIIESMSVLIRPLSLSVRLMANITSSHLVMHLLMEASMKISLVLIFFILFELFVCFIQSYIFYLLLNIYMEEMIF